MLAPKVVKRERARAERYGRTHDRDVPWAPISNGARLSADLLAGRACETSMRSLRSHALMMFFETLFDFPKIVNPYPLAFMLLAIAFNREQALRCSAKSDGGQARACSRRERVAASVLPPRWG